MSTSGSSGSGHPHYWWCLDHARVEADGECRGEVKLGPFDSQAQAESALEAAHERTREWDSADRKWDDD